MDLEIWTMIEKWYSPTTSTTEGIKVLKPKDNCEENEMKNESLNAKATNALICALSSDKFDRVCNYNTAKEISNNLET